MNSRSSVPPTLAGDRLLGPDGPIAVALPGYEPREAQIQMCALVQRVLEGAGGTRPHAMIEAGTGTGKSLAYLLPALLSGRKVAVSTDTLPLQEQLVRKDLPFLARVLAPVVGRPLRFAMAKGRGNYFCPRNAESVVRSKPQGMDPGARAAAEALRAFSSGEWDGDRATLGEGLLSESLTEAHWSLVSGEESCTGRACPHASQCPYLSARARQEEADLLVTNHTLLLLHHAFLERSDGLFGTLPEHAVWIADEAHTLPERCADAFGVELTQREPATYVRRVLRQARALRLSLDLRAFHPEAVTAASDLFFRSFHAAPQQEQLLAELPSELMVLAGERMEALVAALSPLRRALHRAGQEIEPEDAEQRAAVLRLQDTADQLQEHLRLFFTPQPDGADHVAYCQVAADGQGGKEVTLHRKPIETAPRFRRVHERYAAVVHCSATLCCGTGESGWRPVAEELGLDFQRTERLQVASPFNYGEQVLGYLPDPPLPDARHPEYMVALAAEVLRVLTWSQAENAAEGRKWGALVLFASHRELHRVHDLLRHRWPWTLLRQGLLPKEALLRQFQQSDNPVLLGARSFWTGVDLPGDQLSCVVIPRLPFPNPEHPRVKARCARLEAAGRSSFLAFSLPWALRELRQGFGRLIRTGTDRGHFALLDAKCHPRTGARYRERVYRSFPPFHVIHQLATGMTDPAQSVNSREERRRA